MSDSTPNSAASGGAGAHPSGASQKTLDELLAEAQARLEEAKDARMRALAETDNVRKRARLDVEAAQKFAVERFAESLLPVADSLEAALAAGEGAPPALRDGLELTRRQLFAAFEKAKVLPVAPAAGERFDPNRHQAMAAVEAPGAEPNTVVAVMLKGYTLQERTLRPALVTVSKALENKEKAPTSDANPASN